MIKEFQCPDKKFITCKDCLTKCRMERRCIPYGALLAMTVRQRSANPNRLSVTEALSPVCYNWMRLNKSGCVQPVDNMYALIGSLTHMKQEVEDPKIKTEVYLEDELNTGTCDCVLVEDGKRCIRDIKTKKVSAASYLLEYNEIPNPVKGRKPIKRYIIEQKGTKLKSDSDHVLQLNRYKIMWEKKYGEKVDELWVDYTFIDWNKLTSPTIYGLTRQCYSVPVPILKEEDVLNIYQYKHDAVQEALKNKGPSTPCYDEDGWSEFGKESTRCNEYCAYKYVCRSHFKEKGITHKYVFTEKEKVLNEIEKL